MHAKVVKGMFDFSDHFVVVRDKWIFGEEEKGERRKLRIEKLQEEGIQKEYKNELTEVLESKWETLYGETNVEEVYGTLKTTVLGVTESVVGTKVVKKGRGKGVRGGQRRLGIW